VADRALSSDQAALNAGSDSTWFGVCTTQKAWVARALEAFMSRHRLKSPFDPHSEVDFHYWHSAVLQTRNGWKGGHKFDRYRWALHYEQLARKRHGCDVNLKDVLADLTAGWDKFGGPHGLTLNEAKEAVTNSWHRSDELTADTIANHKGFESPPTFLEKGTLVPRNFDEANS
jgi:hypothetical protein